MAEHAPLACSAAPQWGKCAGSVKAQRAHPSGDTAETMEGTATHWVASSVLSVSPPPPCSVFVGLKAPNGVVITEEMADSAAVYVNDVLDTAAGIGGGSLHVEQRLVAPAAVHPENWGTCDAWTSDPRLRLVVVWDFKHGHREHRARDHLQLINYALLLEIPNDWTVEFRIVQPRCYRPGGPVDVWRVPRAHLEPYRIALRDKAVEALSDNPRLTAGEHCRDCRAVADCPAARRSVYSLIDYVNQPYALDGMDNAAKATERAMLLKGLTVARARLDAIEDDLTHRLTQGEAVPGLVLETVQGRVEWSVPPAQAAALADQFGFDIRREAVDTPTQAKEKAPREVRPMFAQVLNTVTRRGAGSLKLTKASDSRTAAAFQPPQED